MTEEPRPVAARDRWDAKYRGALGRAVKEPDPFVLRALERLGAPAPQATALDLAAGTGRHALELARRGWVCAAWDVSSVGLEILCERSRLRGLQVQSKNVDLLGEPPPAERFDLVVVVDFLDRALWGRLARLVRHRGHVIARTFTKDWPGTRPPEAFRLDRGELVGLPGFETILVEEEGGRAGLLGRRTGDSFPGRSPGSSGA